LGRVVCIANQKGGVGKTTTAINLSASLAIAGHRVLLIDLDPQANATSGLGVRATDDMPSTYDLLMGEKSVAEVTTKTSQERLDILPAQRDLVGAEVELVQALAREHRLTEALGPARDNYDIILVDCPPSLGLLTINGLTAANGVLVPLQCEYYALEGLSALMDTFRLIRERLNRDLEIEGILLTMFDTRNSLSHQVAAEVREHFPNKVFATTIPRNVRLSESPSHGIPVAQYDATSKGAQAYLDLAHELMPREGQSAVPSAEPAGERPTPPATAAAPTPEIPQPAENKEVSADHGERAPSQAAPSEVSSSASAVQPFTPEPHTGDTVSDDATQQRENTNESALEVVEDGGKKESLGEGARGVDRPGQVSTQPEPGGHEPGDSSDRGNIT